MAYVVLGVSGNTGKVVAESLLAAGKKVRAVVRDAQKGAALASRGAEIAVADVSDTAALTKAFEGAEAAYVLTPPTMTAPDFRAYQTKVVDSILGAVRAARPAHVVLLSSVGAQHPDGTGPIAALGRAERLLRDVPGVVSTFVRAGYFAGEPPAPVSGTLEQGFVPSFFPKDFPVSMIATVDIGRVAANAMIEGAKTTSIIELGNEGTTMQQVAESLSKITGKPIRVEEAPLDAVVPTFTGFGMPADLAGLYREMIGAIIAGRVAFEGTHRRVLATTPVEAVLRGMLGR